MRLIRALLPAVAAVALACGASSAPGGGEPRLAADDSAVHQQISAGQGGAEVTFNATVVADPVQVGSHEHLNVKTPAGDVLEVDHNTSLATAVPAHAGDHLVIHGQLYVDPGKAGVHCTHHHTSRGCPQPGWIELAGTYFE
ncbi:MAG: hypothetical protein M3Z13_05070 [Candidatus Dormibacteraeota bacterium]|nr:hypothetical protein [Candidatus Dormibacteraeota bacterium]